jgi:hypothetical protein
MLGASSIIFAFLNLLAVAHKEPKSAHEIEVQRALQAAAYHVGLWLSLDERRWLTWRL